MKSVSIRRVGLSTASAALLALVLGLAQAQETAQEPASKPAAKSEKKEKLTGRLPAYYGEVVSKDQREKIYQIQSKYGEQLKKLRDEIEQLDQQQQEEIFAVLSQEQRDHVAKRTADAKAKRSKRQPASAAEGS